MTEAVGAASARRHFSDDEAEALRRDESTSSVVRRDTKIAVDVHGIDRSWEDVKAHQQSHVGIAGGVSVAHGAVEGLEVAELVHFGSGGVVAGAVLGLGIGTHEWLEAQAKGKEQSAAVTRDQAHVAVIGALDLPAGYKSERLDKDYASVPRGSQSAAFKMTESLMTDKAGLAAMQLHADRGMNAARDLARSGLQAKAFLAANPRVADAYAKDAAFREGFDAYLFTKAKQPPAEVRELDRTLDERDGWYAQSQVAIKV